MGGFFAKSGDVQGAAVGGRNFGTVRGFPGFGGRWADFWQSPGISGIWGPVDGFSGKVRDMSRMWRSHSPGISRTWTSVGGFDGTVQGFPGVGGRWVDLMAKSRDFRDLGVGGRNLGKVRGFPGQGGGRNFGKVRGFPGFVGRWAEFWQRPGIFGIWASVGGFLAKSGDFQGARVGERIFSKVRGFSGFGRRWADF